VARMMRRKKDAILEQLSSPRLCIPVEKLRTGRKGNKMENRFMENDPVDQMRMTTASNDRR